MPANNASFIGKAAYWGAGSGTTATGTGLATLLIQSVKFTRSATRANIPNEKGEKVGVAFADFTNFIEIEGIVTGSGLADAKSQMTKTPPPGTVVTIADDDDTELTGTHSGKYFVAEDPVKTKDNTGMVRMSMKLEQAVENDLTASVGA